MALTFDDGPDPKWTPRVAAVLRRERVPGAFFVVGSEAARHPELVRMLDAAGSLAADFPGRFFVLVSLSVALMLVGEYRPRGLLRGATSVWLGLGAVASISYLLGTF